MSEISKGVLIATPRVTIGETAAENGIRKLFDRGNKRLHRMASREQQSDGRHHRIATVEKSGFFQFFLQFFKFTFVLGDFRFTHFDFFLQFFCFFRHFCHFHSPVGSTFEEKWLT
ncbi:hypothetical protein [Photobacterium halotolerans]|uniref:hypothetical protein n=1 Tax=Photobacterium halotolerans TaxID=265726 RepID=UPI00138B15FC|nr:hypothetical protein [Photobacterium halotolerans]